MAELPIEKDEAFPDAISEEQSADRPTQEKLEAVARIHLLIVDDDAPTCQVIQAALEHDDFHICSVSNVARIESALKAATEYHLIVLDYILPGLETKDVLNWIREHQPDASLIIITGYPSLEGAVSGLRARAYDYLTKPFQISELRATVLRCLQGKGLMRLSPNALRQAVGSAVRERRKVLNLTLAELARRAGTSVGYLSQIELGRVSPSIDTLYKISLTLGIRLADLFHGMQLE